MKYLFKTILWIILVIVAVIYQLLWIMWHFKLEDKNYVHPVYFADNIVNDLIK